MLKINTNKNFVFHIWPRGKQTQDTEMVKTGSTLLKYSGLSFNKSCTERNTKFPADVANMSQNILIFC